MVILYNRYLFHLSIEHFGKDPKYISKDDKALGLFGFINTGTYNVVSDKIPKTPLTEYLFGDEDYYDLVDRFNVINNRLEKKRAENLKKLRNGELPI